MKHRIYHIIHLHGSNARQGEIVVVAADNGLNLYGRSADERIAENNLENALDDMLTYLKENNFEAVTPSKLFEVKGIKNIPLGVNIDKI